MARVLIFLMVLCGQAFGCLWDRDTLEEEAKGRPELVRVLVGWFDRYPARYYQMRLERVMKEVEARPSELGLYDDAGVACDRLGRPDEAIGWMTRKKAVLDSMPAERVKGDRYRYLSNLGTFHLHRWILLPREKRDADLADLRESEKLIARALEENPDAHFGREIYQLMAIRWLLWDGTSVIVKPEGFPYFTFDQIHWVATKPLVPDGMNQEHIDGLSGLMQLGIAWESSDAFRSLAAVLDTGKLASMAELAYQREKELMDAGKGSLHPVAKVREMTGPEHSQFLMLPRVEAIDDYYPVARAAADKRNTAWVAYQEARYAKGMHPDTDADFWKEWSEPEFPPPPGFTMRERVEDLLKKYALVVILVVLGGAVALTLVVFDFLRKKRRWWKEIFGA